MTTKEKLMNEVKDLERECIKIRKELKEKYESYKNKKLNTLFFYDVCINQKPYKINKIEMISSNTSRDDENGISTQILIIFEDDYTMYLELKISDIDFNFR